MAVELSIPYTKEFEVDKTVTEVAPYFKNISETIQKNFPGLQSISQKPNGSYEWIFQELAHAGYNLQIKFSTFFKEVEPQIVEIIPVNASETSLAGKVSYAEKNGKTQIKFDWTISLVLPIPSLLKGMAKSFAQKELNKLFDRFALNVQNSLA